MTFTKFTAFDKVLRIMHKDYYSLREASHIYDPSLDIKTPNHRTVKDCFRVLEDKKMLKSKMISRSSTREGKYKSHTAISTWKRPKLRDDFYLKYCQVTGKSELITILRNLVNEEDLVNYLFSSEERVLDHLDKLFYFLYMLSSGFDTIMISKEKELFTGDEKIDLTVSKKQRESNIRKYTTMFSLKSRVAMLLRVYSAKIKPLLLDEKNQRVFSKLSTRINEVQDMQDFFDMSKFKLSKEKIDKYIKSTQL